MTDPKPNYKLVDNNIPKHCSYCGRPFKNREDWNNHCVPDDCLTHSVGYIRALENKIQRVIEQRDRYKAENEQLKNCINCIHHKLGHCSEEDINANGMYCPNWSYSLRKKHPDPEPLKPKICVDCKSEIIDECGIFDTPDGTVCRAHHEKRKQ